MLFNQLFPSGKRKKAEEKARNFGVYSREENTSKRAAIETKGEQKREKEKKKLK